jgi:tetratricopeptide (TPR) repeat protein
MSLRLSAFATVLLWSVCAWAFAHANVGDRIDDIELPALFGQKGHLLGNAAVNVFIFFKPGQEHSNATLKQIAACEKEFAGKSVHWVALVSDRFPKEAIKADVKEAGIAMLVLIDEGDALYGKLGVALTPVIGLADRDHKLAAYLPFSKVNYSEIIRAHIRKLLGEITEEEMNQVLKPPEIIQGSDPELARRRLRLAEKLFDIGSYEKALESVKKSIEYDPSSAAAHALLGSILAAQGRKTEALKAFEAALKLDPSNAAALKGVKEIQGRLQEH